MIYIQALAVLAAIIVWFWFELATEPDAPEIMTPLATFMMVLPVVVTFIYSNT